MGYYVGVLHWGMTLEFGETMQQSVMSSTVEAARSSAYFISEGRVTKNVGSMWGHRGTVPLTLCHHRTQHTTTTAKTVCKKIQPNQSKRAVRAPESWEWRSERPGCVQCRHCCAQRSNGPNVKPTREECLAKCCPLRDPPIKTAGIRVETTCLQ